MKILLLDIETAPNLAYVWGLFKENIGTSQIVNSGYVISWAAKWYGNGKLIFNSIHKSSAMKMLRQIHALLDEADVVVHYNGNKFDIPTLNKEFVIHNLKPPAPSKHVDLIETVRKVFRFPSNKLDYVMQTLKLGRKVRHKGFELWIQCMKGHNGAWKAMEQYNKQDVILLEEGYKKLLPWIQRHPNHGAHDGISSCPHCGKADYERRGYALTTMYKYPRYHCRNCGAWFRGTKTVTHKSIERFAGIS